MRQSKSIEKLAHFGSTVRGTAVRDYSDLDILSIIRGPRPDQPLESVQIIIDSLESALDGYLDVEQDYPAVKVLDPFTGLPIDFIPAHRNGQGNYSIYDVATGSWILTTPHLHNTYITQTKRYDRHAPTIFRLIKVWNFLAELKLSSLYLELSAATTLREASYDNILRVFLACLTDLQANRLRALPDPVMPGEREIQPGIAGFNRDEVMELLENSIDYGHAADAAEKARSREQCQEFLACMLPHSLSQSSGSSYQADRDRLRNFVEKFRQDPRYRDQLPRRTRHQTYHRRRDKPFSLG
ncbi:MAG: nucleotidyltransferase domain-containing protein [Mycobacterium sp.]